MQDNPTPKSPSITVPIIPPELATILNPDSTWPPAPYRQQLAEAVQNIMDYLEPDPELRLWVGTTILQMLLLTKALAPMHLT